MAVGVPAVCSRGGVPGLTQVCRFSQGLTQVCRFSQGLTQVCRFSPGLTQVCRFSQGLTQVCRFSPLLASDTDSFPVLAAAPRAPRTRSSTPPWRPRRTRALPGAGAPHLVHRQGGTPPPGPRHRTATTSGTLTAHTIHEQRRQHSLRRWRSGPPALPLAGAPHGLAAGQVIRVNAAKGPPLGPPQRAAACHTSCATGGGRGPASSSVSPAPDASSGPAAAAVLWAVEQ